MAAVSASKFEMGIPNDGCIHDWVWEGKTYYATYNGDIWAKMLGGEYAYGWVGVMDMERGIIDTSMPEPEYEYEDEDDEKEFYVHLQREVQRWEAPPNG